MSERTSLCRATGLTSLGAAIGLSVVCALVWLGGYNDDKADGWDSYEQLSEENKIEDNSTLSTGG